MPGSRQAQHSAPVLAPRWRACSGSDSRAGPLSPTSETDRMETYRYVRPQPPEDVRIETVKCQTVGCGAPTRHRKPYCPDHVESMPYVQEILAQLDREPDVVEEIRSLLWEFPVLSLPLACKMLEADPVDVFRGLKTLEARGEVTLTEGDRGKLVAQPARVSRVA